MELFYDHGTWPFVVLLAVLVTGGLGFAYVALRCTTGRPFNPSESPAEAAKAPVRS